MREEAKLGRTEYHKSLKNNNKPINPNAQKILNSKKKKNPTTTKL